MCTESKLIKTTLDDQKVNKNDAWNEKNKLFGPDQKKILQKI